MTSSPSARTPIVAAIAFAALQAAHAAPVYTLTDLGPDTTAAAINAKGSVVGVHAGVPSIWKAGTWTPVAGASGATVTAINKSGATAGWVAASTGRPEPATWNAKGKQATIGVPAPDTSGYANGIADDGTVVGYERSFQGVNSVFTYGRGVRVEMTCGNGAVSCDAWAINANGQFTGEISNAAGGFDAYVQTAGTWKDIGTLGGFNGVGQALNGAGHVAGASTTAKSGDNFHAFLYDGEKMRDLGTLTGVQSWALGIDDSDTVVGYTQDSKRRKDAFVYFGGMMYALSGVVSNADGWHLNVATGIDHAGRIVGNGAIGGVPHAFLLDLRSR